jgi:hypothetical protein
MPRKPTRPSAPQAAPPPEPEPVAPPANTLAPQAAPAVPEPPPAAALPPERVADEPLLEHGQPMLEPLTAYELSPKILLAGGDRAFAADLDPEVRDFGSTRNIVRVCEWCNTPLSDPDAAQCPSCGANLKPLEPDQEIPGLTTMSLEAELARRRAEAQQQATSNASNGILRSAGSILGTGRATTPAAPAVVTSQGLQLDDATIEEAIRPPDDAVRRAMLQLEIEALKAQAPGVVPGGIDPAAIVADATAEPGSEGSQEHPAGATDAAADASAAGPPVGA